MQFEIHLYQYTIIAITSCAILIVLNFLKAEKRMRLEFKKSKFELAVLTKQLIEFDEEQKLKSKIIVSQMESTTKKLRSAKELSTESDLIRRIESQIQYYACVWKN